MVQVGAAAVRRDVLPGGARHQLRGAATRRGVDGRQDVLRRAERGHGSAAGCVRVGARGRDQHDGDARELVWLRGELQRRALVLGVDGGGIQR